VKKIFLLIPLAAIIASCGKESTEKAAPKKREYALFKHGSRPVQPKPVVKKVKEEVIEKVGEERVVPELDFEVENATGKTIYIACFSYIQKEPLVRWRWDKSSIQKLEDGQRTFVNIDTIPDHSNREEIFGYLAVFEDESKAHNSIYELLDDRQKIDLDLLHRLKGKKVVVGVEKYGFKKAKLDFAIVEKLKKKRPAPELDFIVENGTGRTIFLTAFIYQVKDNSRMVWHYDKTPVQKLEQGQMSVVNVDTVEDDRDRTYMRGYLSVFEEHEEDKAHDATYELLDSKNKMSLDRLSRLKNQKVVIGIEQYGAIGEVAEFDIKPTRSPLYKLRHKENEDRSGYCNTCVKIEDSNTKINKKTKTLPKKNKGTYQLFS